MTTIKEPFIKTFSDGFAVRVNGRKIGTNCKNQATWLDGIKIASYASTLMAQNPQGCNSADEFVALAVYQLRCAWIGQQQLSDLSKPLLQDG
jgi:hypothetical protein